MTTAAASGGNMERPGLQRLLRDIDHGKIDIVVVYKVDRLTRSLSDFARIVDRFDAKGASFVSVTQSFNTTTSMGRLTLNMLLSFAQFEREVTGERIRDKIAASKAKGMWMGGNLPLGYDPSGRTLTINAPEAEQVRAIFARYLQVQSVHKLVPLLAAEGVRSKVRIVARTGLPIGGGPMNRGALFHLLSNRIYLGQIVHKGEAHPGLHPAIIDEDTFAQVQALLAQGRYGLTGATGRRRDAPTGACGRNARRYRVSKPAPSGARGAAGAYVRLSGPQIERYLAEQVRRLLGSAARWAGGGGAAAHRAGAGAWTDRHPPAAPGRSPPAWPGRHRQAAGGGRAGVVRRGRPGRDRVPAGAPEVSRRARLAAGAAWSNPPSPAAQRHPHRRPAARPPDHEGGQRLAHAGGRSAAGGDHAAQPP